MDSLVTYLTHLTPSSNKRYRKLQESYCRGWPLILNIVRYWHLERGYTVREMDNGSFYFEELGVACAPAVGIQKSTQRGRGKGPMSRTPPFSS